MKIHKHEHNQFDYDKNLSTTKVAFSWANQPGLISSAHRSLGGENAP